MASTTPGTAFAKPPEAPWTSSRGRGRTSLPLGFPARGGLSWRWTGRGTPFSGPSAGWTRGWPWRCPLCRRTATPGTSSAAFIPRPTGARSTGRRCSRPPTSGSPSAATWATGSAACTRTPSVTRPAPGRWTGKTGVWKKRTGPTSASAFAGTRWRRWSSLGSCWGR